MRTMMGGVMACGLAMVAGSAVAQPLEALTFTIEWDKAVISHGETNTGKVVATITPQIGAVTAWNTVPGTGQVGTLEAFASTIFDLLGKSNATNGALAWTVPADVNAANKPGTPGPDGGIVGTFAGQFSSAPILNLNQAVTVLKLEWKESAGTGVYDVLFQSKMLTAKVFLDVGLSSWVGENCVKVDGQGGFSVVPGPGVMGGLVVAFGLARRRRVVKETNR